MGTISIVCVLSLIIVSISTLPITIEKVPIIELHNVVEDSIVTEIVSEKSTIVKGDQHNVTTGVSVNELTTTANLTLRNVRPGMSVTTYDVEITPNVAGRSFTGKLLAAVTITDDTRDIPIIFNVEGLTVTSVQLAIGSSEQYNPAIFMMNDNDDLEIFASLASSYTLIIEYTGDMGTAPQGMFSANDGSYIGMHLSPTYARRVFPCIDELTHESSIRFNFRSVNFDHVVSNSLREEGEEGINYQFKSHQGPPFRWGMVAHNLKPVAIALGQVEFFVRADVERLRQESFATTAITEYLEFLDTWTARSYFNTIENDNNVLTIVSLPDTSVDWIALASVCLWEPDILMETNPSMKQRKTALFKIAEGLSRQWFGNIIYPETWNHMWIINGLGSYAAYEAAKKFQTSDVPDDNRVLDVDTLIVTDFIRESLLLDSHDQTTPLQPAEPITDLNAIRDHINGIIKYKSPALFRMFRLALNNPNTDLIQTSSAALLRARTQRTVNYFQYLTELEGAWQANSNFADFEAVETFINRWITNKGYPVLNVQLRQGGVIVSEEPFSFAAQNPVAQDPFIIPLTYTTNTQANFGEDEAFNVHRMMIDRSAIIDVNLDEDDFVLFNIRGQGYYRVNYQAELWERIIFFLQDPEQRDVIHPLNRAVLVDDSLNLARGRKVDYGVALQLALTMESETQYAPWKAYVRNMEIIRRALELMVAEDEDLDATIYQRMLRRVLVTFENDIGFTPDPNVQEDVMTSLTRGLVMEHACKAGYEPCIAAAVDWFTGGPDPAVVNPNIPPEIRPAVYCAMVSQGGQEPINALNERLAIEESAYERVVIIQSLACSPDTDFIQNTIIETLNGGVSWGIEEKIKFFEAVVESNLANFRVAVDILSRRVSDIRNMYGGEEKLESLLYHVARHIVDGDSHVNFRRLIRETDTGIDNSVDAGRNALIIADENLQWSDDYRAQIYEWIDENGAPSLIISFSLLLACIFIALANY